MCACAFPLLGIFDSVVTAAQTELENGRQRRVSASPSFFIIVSLWVDQKGNPKEFWMLKKKKKEWWWVVVVGKWQKFTRNNRDDLL